MTDQHYRQTPPWQQLLYLLSLWLGCTIIGLAITLAVIAGIYGRDMAWHVLSITNTGGVGFIGAFRIFIGLGNTIFPFFVPSVIFGYWIMREPEVYIKARNYFPLLLLVVTLGFMLFFLPVIDITGYFNQKMTLPPSLHGLEQWIRDTEKQNEAVVKIVLNMKGIADLLFSLFIVALLPAISEEFFFRGCMQPVFQRMTKNMHAAVWITAFVFSFFHFEFLGFVPRMLLGAALGYMFAWSGSIWPSVFAHFLNNGVAVLGMYLYQHHQVTTNPESNVPMFSQLWIYLLSFATAVFFMLLYRKISMAHQEALIDDDGEELD